MVGFSKEFERIYITNMYMNYKVISDTDRLEKARAEMPRDYVVSDHLLKEVGELYNSLFKEPPKE